MAGCHKFVYTYYFFNYSVPSAAPTSFSANAISPRTINTTWEPPSPYHLSGIITSYTLTYRGVEGDTSLKTKILTVLNGSIYITPALTDLEEDTHYEISVRANTSVGAGPWVNLTVHTPEDGEYNYWSTNLPCAECGAHLNKATIIFRVLKYI